MYTLNRSRDKFFFDKFVNGLTVLATFTVFLFNKLHTPIKLRVTTYGISINRTTPCEVVTLIDDEAYPNINTRKGGWGRFETVSRPRSQFAQGARRRGGGFVTNICQTFTPG